MTFMWKAILQKLCGLDENKTLTLGSPKKILVVRQHNQLGDMLANVSLFRALKVSFPGASITLIAGVDNFIAITDNRYIDRCFVYNKKKLFNPFYFFKLISMLRSGYDLAIVPVTVSVSFTSNFIARISDAKSRLGVSSLSGKKNDYDFLFDRRVDMDWRKYPDANVSDFCLDILRPFGISTQDFSSEITISAAALETADKFISDIKKEENSLLIGLHVGAGKPPNRWPLDSYIELIKLLQKEYKAVFFLTGSSADSEEINYAISHCEFNLPVFMNRSIPEVAALISKADLFITNDTGIMHVAGATHTSQISIFGPTNPFNWAPIGKNKEICRRSEFISDVTVGDVYEKCKKLISESNISKR